MQLQSVRRFMFEAAAEQTATAGVIIHPASPLIQIRSAAATPAILISKLQSELVQVFFLQLTCTQNDL